MVLYSRARILAWPRRGKLLQLQQRPDPACPACHSKTKQAIVTEDALEVRAHCIFRMLQAPPRYQPGRVLAPTELLQVPMEGQRGNARRRHSIANCPISWSVGSFRRGMPKFYEPHT